MAPSKRKILVIEDEKAIAHALELKLTHAGLDVAVRFNGEDGLKFLEKEKAHMILLDLIMPKQDGFFVLESLRQKNNATPVIVLSNLSQEEDRNRALALGAKEFFIKSDTSITSIVEHVCKLLE